jgi:hypothetical protein
MKISYCITVCDESEEIKRLMDHMVSHVDLKKHEIIILCDSGKTNKEVESICEEHAKQSNIFFVKDEFQNHFADWKNKFKEFSTGQYIFQIDADELPTEFMLTNLEFMLAQNPQIDLFWVPRENYVDGITEEHTIKWNMTVDTLGRINFPDYQARIFKNLPDIKWANRVHEIIVGSSKQAGLPTESRFCLLHIKNIKKQEKQNNYYETLT